MPDPSQKPEEAVILIVEDNEDDVFLMERALKAAKVTSPYRVVSDGEEATRYLKGEGIYADRAKYPYPAVIFLDLKLPYMSGFEVLEWKLKNKELPPTIVIVITSSNEAKDLKRAYSLGAVLDIRPRRINCPKIPRQPGQLLEMRRNIINMLQHIERNQRIHLQRISLRVLD